MKVQNIQTIFETLQAQISNLKLREQEKSWCSRKSGLDRCGHWKNDSLLDRPISEQFKRKVHVFSDSVLCLCEKILIILKRPIYSATSTKVQNIDLSTTSQFERVELVRHRPIFPGALRICLRKKVCQSPQVNERILFMSIYNDID